MSLNPKKLLYGVLIITYALILIQIRPQEPVVFSLIIVSVLLIVLRLRFNVATNLLYLDIIFYVALLFYADYAYYLMLPTFILIIYKGNYWIIAAYPLIMVSRNLITFETLTLSIFTGVSALLLHQFEHHHKTLIQAVDKLKEKHYILEQEKYTLMQEQEDIARMSTLEERDRIAVTLHDNLGHELTAALLASRAFETTSDEALKSPSYKALKARLEKAVDALKNTVHNTKTLEPYGYDQFTSMLEAFTYAPLETSIPRDVSMISVKRWYILNTVVKEALTNVRKHATPTHVSVALTISPPLIKLVVKNDGLNTETSSSGVGLQFMRKRLEQQGGTLTTQKGFIFTLLCTMPLS